MSLSASDLVAQLAAAGTPPELLAAVAKELFNGEAERAALSERRRHERERKAKSRAVTGQDGTSCDTPETVSPLTPPLKVSPNPFKNTPPITPHPNDIGERAKSSFSPPDGVEIGQWRAFRQQRKKPINERSYALLCNKLKALAEAGYPPGEMIDLAIERGWETVFEPKEQRNGYQQQRQSGIGRTEQAALAALRS